MCSVSRTLSRTFGPVALCLWGAVKGKLYCPFLALFPYERILCGTSILSTGLWLPGMIFFPTRISTFNPMSDPGDELNLEPQPRHMSSLSCWDLVCTRCGLSQGFSHWCVWLHLPTVLCCHLSINTSLLKLFFSFVGWLLQQFAVKCLMCTFKALLLSSSVFSSWVWSEFPSPKHSSSDPSWRVRWYCRQAGHLCLEWAAAGLWRGLPAWFLRAGAPVWQLSPRPASEWGCWWKAVWWFPARDETSALLLLLTNHWREVFQHS